MRTAVRGLLVAVLTISTALGAAGLARADISNSTGTNVQNGDNRSTGTQNSGGKSGDAVGGQVSGVVSSGRTSVDARSTSSNSDVTSGDARGSNSASTFTGLNRSHEVSLTADITAVENADNLQDGSNRSTYTQSASATTGDGVAGEVIGAVTGTGGSASIVAANRSDNVDVTTGDANGTNDFAAFTGLDSSHNNPVTISDITDSCDEQSCFNVQNGANRATATQSTTAATGDGVAGQVIGAVSSGATSIDANNTSTNDSVTTGDARTGNDVEAFVGQNVSALKGVGSGGVTIGDVSGVPDTSNLQDGSNRALFNQTSSAKTGDGVGGEVIGAVTSAGGSASIVAANTSNNTDITTGDASSTNGAAAFVGLNRSSSDLIATDITDSCAAACENVQNGDNRFTDSQTATSQSGDGVGGQVLGVVSAGATSLDATNHTDDSSVETGNADSSNTNAFFVGLNTTEVGGVTVGDISGVPQADNVQDGSNRKTDTQSASATSGDGVAGQVSGVVTSAGGSASVVLANTSTSIDSTSGESRFDNTDSGFVGQNESPGPLTIG